jgi:chemotaxis protein CheD
MKVKVNISDVKVSKNPTDVLVTYALGSCIGLCLYDPKACIGGMLHCLLPDSKKNPEKARQNPFTYANSGMNLLLDKLLSIGATKRRIQVKIVGGAKRFLTETDAFDIGKHNYLATRKALWKSGLFIRAEDVGGSSPRTMYMYMADGSVMIRSGDHKKRL